MQQSITQKLNKMNNKLLSLLQCTSHQLEMITLKHYMFWCEIYAQNDVELQMYLASPSLFRWWLSTYSQLQRNFIAIAQPYQDVASPAEMNEIYIAETILIGNYYSIPLLRASKIKRNITPELN